MGNAPSRFIKLNRPSISTEHSMLVTFFSSNLVQLFLTSLTGAGLYLGFAGLRLWRPAHFDRAFLVFMKIAMGVAFLIFALCFILNLGETYRYSFLYKRTFSFFGDGFAPVFLFFLLFFLVKRQDYFAILALSSIVLSGGKMVIISSLLCYVFLALHGNIGVSFFKCVKHYICSFLLYILLLATSHMYEHARLPVSEHARLPVSEHARLPVSEHGNIFIEEKRYAGKKACENIYKCFDTQVLTALKQRIISSTAGIYMMFRGGFAGPNYPSEKEEFADLLFEANPYGVNEFFNLSWHDWHRIGEIEHPYLNFGASYGVVSFICLIMLIASTIFVGLRDLSLNRDSSYRFLTYFFLLTCLVNQTQQWIQSFSEVFILVALSGSHIWVSAIVDKMRLKK